MPAPDEEPPAAADDARAASGLRSADAGDAYAAASGPRAPASAWSPWAAVGLFGVVLFLAAWASHSFGTGIAAWDDASIAWGAAQPPAVVSLALGLQWVGRGILVAPASVVLGLLLAWRGFPWRGATAIAVVAAGSAGAALLKEFVGRGRPEAAVGWTTDFSFPSGHATLGAVVACLLVWLALPYARSAGQRALVLIAAIVWAVAMALSRVVLNMHYLSDVIAGVGLGLGVSGVVIAASILLRERVSSRVGVLARQNG